MSESDVPAGRSGGLSNLSETPELTEKVRVHALAKLVATTSRRVLDTLAELGSPARGAQSSVDRPTAQRVIEALSVETEAKPDTEPEKPEKAETEAGDELQPEAGGALPLFAAPMFLPPGAAPSRPAPQAPAKPARPDAEDEAEDDDEPDTDADATEEGGDTKRRRRRGRRGRGRGRGTDDETAENGDADTDDEDGKPAGKDSGRDAGKDSGKGSGKKAPEAAESDDDEDGDSEDAEDAGSSGGGSRRRRRRRRRKDGDSDDSGSDDPPNTVTKIRESRAKPDSGDDGGNSGIQGVRGSTRLEAKRQRRRDGRDAGRRRAPVLSEAEFLARRESVERTMVVRQRGERSEIGVLEDGVLCEHFVTSSGGTSLVGNVYLGRVQNVLPSMEAAFVDIGRGRNAVLYAGEVDWDAAGLAGKARRIEQALSSGDNVLVQVTKDPIGHKGARLTTQISLPGRFLVYVPSGGTHGISRKLPDVERRRLKDLLKEILPEDAGVIIRTASEGVSQEALERDVRRLQAQWDVVKEKAGSATGSGKGRSKAPELLYEEPDLMIKVVRDQFNEDFSKLVVEGDDAWDTLHAYIGHVAPELVERLSRHVGRTDVFSDFRIDEQLTKALDRKVWLPSGGTLVIDRTEAMTVIDVNTGKFTGSGGNLEETVTRNNLEAAEEIVRQLRLRDIGGIIVIDFIDMVLESNRDLVLRRLTECLGRDRTRHQVAEVTSLGLVQMTRKRVGVGLLEAFSTPCEHCRGRGVVVSSDPVEHRPEQGQHGGSSSGGRRRGRGGEPDGGNARRGGDSDGGNGRRRGAPGGQGGPKSEPAAVPSPKSEPAAVSTPKSEPAAVPTPKAEPADGPTPEHGPANGKPVPAPPARPRTDTEPAPSSVAAEPAAGSPVSGHPVDSPAPAAAASSSPANTTAPEPPARPAGGDSTAPVASHPSGQDAAGGALAPAGPGGPAAEPHDLGATDPVVPGHSSGTNGAEPVAVGAPAGSEPPARPARRRRRSASRPAGPPAGGTAGDPV
ncbi:translation initiation factor IF-2 N-terminal domain-containing protein [Pseudonocardia eucalypti]|uniref:Translation initiation factor IF-2 N-terminal domain-containing protein n=1 Tax=Pseudonocardia eucalypti TaxID=648755 RepID=A0ABP9Q0V7_9PSEU|nr:ribonuclease E [Pseudonocardia eucalypti]